MAPRKIKPPFLKPGDEVAIVSPAFSIEEARIEEAVRMLESWDLKVHTGKNLLKKSGPFAGTDEERLADLQEFTSNNRIRAIFCSRGGYGVSRIISRIDFSNLRRYPRWYVGFSDITVLHLWLSQNTGLISIHGEMPLNYSNPEKSRETMETLCDSLFTGCKPIEWSGEFIRPTDVTGEITGGNLSLIYSLTGTKGEPETEDKILFIEDIGEYYYHIDRMLTSLKLAGKLNGLKALLIGGMNEMQDGKVPWGKSVEATISEITREFNYPVLFGFPAGHIPDNRAFYLGADATIRLSGNSATLSYD